LSTGKGWGPEQKLSGSALPGLLPLAHFLHGDAASSNEPSYEVGKPPVALKKGHLRLATRLREPGASAALAGANIESHAQNWRTRKLVDGIVQCRWIAGPELAVICCLKQLQQSRKGSSRPMTSKANKQ
jgi:hypothetical protein